MTQRPETDEFDQKVRELLDDGEGTGGVAQILGCKPAKVTAAKRRLGMTRGTNGNPLHNLTEQMNECLGVLEAMRDATLPTRWPAASDEQRAEFLGKVKALIVAARRLIPGSREQDQIDLSDALEALFEAEPEQPGADAIARKLGRRAADVRAELQGWIETGEIEAIGNGRARRYRKVDPRPEAGRETTTAGNPVPSPDAQEE
jgi:hypothetical protein